MIPSRTMLGFGEAKSCEPGHRARLFPKGEWSEQRNCRGGVNPCAGGFGRTRSYASGASYTSYASGCPNVQGVQALVEASKR